MKRYMDEQIVRNIIERYDKLSKYRSVDFSATSYSENTDPTDHFGDYTHNVKYANNDVWVLIEFCRRIVNTNNDDNKKGEQNKK